MSVLDKQRPIISDEPEIYPESVSWPKELKAILGALIDLATRVTATNKQALLLNEVLTSEELAARFKVPISTIEELARKGKLPGAFRVGKHWRFDLDRLRLGLPEGEGDHA